MIEKENIVEVENFKERTKNLFSACTASPLAISEI